MSEANIPFRWKIESSEQLGSLLDADFKLEDWLLYKVRYCAARILTFSQDSRLIFVGRSLDSVFDYLSGILENTSWNDRLIRLNISLYGHSIQSVKEKNPKSYDTLKRYFEELLLDPVSIKSNRIPTSFADVVFNGGTYEQIFLFLNNWSNEIENDNTAMNKKLRFIGITERKKSSPNTWRWQQQKEWTDNLRSSNIKNISVDYWFWTHIADSQPKITKSFRPKSWNKENNSPIHSESSIKALNEAHALYNEAKKKSEKLEFAKKLSTKEALKKDWLRKLCLEIKS